MHCKPPLATYIALGYFAASLVFHSCRGNVKAYFNPPGYHLNNPYVITLPAELNDISGIAYYAKDNSLFAESDQKGGLYKINLNKPTDIRKWKISHKRDYEDIALVDTAFYLLNNNGDLLSASFSHDSLSTHEFTFPENGKNEFETLYYDSSQHKLVMICKECETDKKTELTAYAFDPAQQAYSAAFKIDVANIAAMNSPQTTRFKPSAAAINPATGQLYILSSINKLLVAADKNGAIKEIYNLDPAIFHKPEGIAFTANGSLFISNEAEGRQPATILYFQNSKTNSK